MKKIVNCETGEIVERELTDKEIAQQQLDADAIAKAQAILSAEQLAKATAKTALLERLGITEEEAKLLLG